MKFNLEATEVDHYVYISKSKTRLIMTLFEGDSLAICSSAARLEDLVHHMERHFGITRLNPNLYVGLHILCLQASGHIFIHQAIYFRRILSRFGFNECILVNVPSDPNTKLDISG